MRDGKISPEIQRLPSEGKEAAGGGGLSDVKIPLRMPEMGFFGLFSFDSAVATQYNWHYEFVSVQGRIISQNRNGVHAHRTDFENIWGIRRAKSASDRLISNPGWDSE